MSQEFSNEWVSAYLDDELAPDERLQFERAMDADPDLRQLYQDLRSLRGHLRSLERPVLDADVFANVLQRAEAEARKPALNSGGSGVNPQCDWRQFTLRFSAVAAAMVLAVFVIGQHEPSKRNVAASHAPRGRFVNGTLDDDFVARRNFPSGEAMPSPVAASATWGTEGLVDASAGAATERVSEPIDNGTTHEPAAADGAEPERRPDGSALSRIPAVDGGLDGTASVAKQYSFLPGDKARSLGEEADRVERAQVYFVDSVDADAKADDVLFTKVISNRDQLLRRVRSLNEANNRLVCVNMTQSGLAKLLSDLRAEKSIRLVEQTSQELSIREPNSGGFGGVWDFLGRSAAKFTESAGVELNESLGRSSRSRFESALPAFGKEPASGSSRAGVQPGGVRKRAGAGVRSQGKPTPEPIIAADAPTSYAGTVEEKKEMRDKRGRKQKVEADKDGVDFSPEPARRKLSRLSTTNGDSIRKGLYAIPAPVRRQSVDKPVTVYFIIRTNKELPMIKAAVPANAPVDAAPEP